MVPRNWNQLDLLPFFYRERCLRELQKVGGEAADRIVPEIWLVSEWPTVDLPHWVVTRM